MKFFYILLLQFVICVALNAQSNPSDTLTTQPDIEASFPGSGAGWTQYLVRNLRYPPAAMNQQIVGSVTVKFMVDEKGKLREIKPLSGPVILQDEAIRLIKSSPRWTPAIKNGEKVNSYKILSIGFRLE